MMVHKIDRKLIWGSVPKLKNQCSKTEKFCLLCQTNQKTHILDPDFIDFG